MKCAYIFLVFLTIFANFIDCSQNIYDITKLEKTNNNNHEVICEELEVIFNMFRNNPDPVPCFSPENKSLIKKKFNQLPISMPDDLHHHNTRYDLGNQYKEAQKNIQDVFGIMFPTVTEAHAANILAVIESCDKKNIPVLIEKLLTQYWNQWYKYEKDREKQKIYEEICKQSVPDNGYKIFVYDSVLKKISEKIPDSRNGLFFANYQANMNVISQWYTIIPEDLKPDFDSVQKALRKVNKLLNVGLPKQIEQNQIQKPREEKRDKTRKKFEFLREQQVNWKNILQYYREDDQCKIIVFYDYIIPLIKQTELMLFCCNDGISLIAIMDRDAKKGTIHFLIEIVKKYFQAQNDCVVFDNEYRDALFKKTYKTLFLSYINSIFDYVSQSKMQITDDQIEEINKAVGNKNEVIKNLLRKIEWIVLVENNQGVYQSDDQAENQENGKNIEQNKNAQEGVSSSIWKFVPTLNKKNVTIGISLFLFMLYIAKHPTHFKNLFYGVFS